MSAPAQGRGQSILLIDKNMDALGGIADRHVILEEKSRIIVWQGDTAALLADAAITRQCLGV